MHRGRLRAPSSSLAGRRRRLRETFTTGARAGADTGEPRSRSRGSARVHHHAQASPIPNRQRSIPLRLTVLAAALGLAAPAAAEITVSPNLSVMYDVTSVDSDVHDYGDTIDRFRRFRPGLTVGVDGEWALKFEHDLADRSAPEASLQVNLGPGDMLRIGQFKQPFLMEDAISDKQTPFLEQSLAGTLSLGRRLGVGLERVRPDWTLAGSLIGQRLDGTQERVGVTSRATRVLWRDGDALLHVGGSLAGRTTSSAASG